MAHLPLPSLPPINPFNQGFVATHVHTLLEHTPAHLTLVTLQLETIKRELVKARSLETNQHNLVVSMLLSFPLIAGQGAQGAQEKTTDQRRRGCPEACLLYPPLYSAQG